MPLIAVECGGFALGAALTVLSMHRSLVSACALQLGPGVEVIAFTSVGANLAAIVGGILVFRDTTGDRGRVVAFGLAVAGTAFMPAPVGAARSKR